MSADQSKNAAFFFLHLRPSAISADKSFLFGRHRFALILSVLLCGVSSGKTRADEPQLKLQPHDRIALVGNSLAERMRLFGNFEACLHLRFPQHELVVRNFGWPADEVGRQ
jgi:hypothetical protein